ncbi:hypothetical protein KEM52_004215 [Ascosphaera acerosa]|nr:hypothetical protein KEM52_004215 [Ascosphaera acerosa]
MSSEQADPAKATEGGVVEDTHEKSTSLSMHGSVNEKGAFALSVTGETIVPEGKPWMYRSMKIGPIKLPYYASPMAQLLIVAFVCFLCPGMFNAVNGLGGAGMLDHTVADRANIAVYACFAVVGFFAGSITNVIGTRFALFFGGFGYFMYVASLLCYMHTQNGGFTIFAGALMGVCAGCLWAAQGTVMMSYPEEENKGKYIGIFWVIFNLGGVIGSLIPLGQNIHSVNNSVKDGTYIAFMVLMFVGFVLASFLIDAKYVRRQDGSRVIVMKHPSWKTELLGLLSVIRTDSYIIALFPMFFASNWFYTYHFNIVNSSSFNIRTRSLNNVIYWSMQMVGAIIFGQVLDLKYFKRTTRAKMGWAIIFSLGMAIWGGGYAYHRTMPTREELGDDPVLMDWTDSGFGGPFVLYMFYGFYDAVFQTFVYWSMGALSNNSRKLANFAGFYKGIQSAGAAGAWAYVDSAYHFTFDPIIILDNDKASFAAEFGSSWGLVSGSLLIAAPIIYLKVRDTTAIDEDLKFSDATAAEVVGEVHVDANKQQS